jgi:hypothetical protein
MTLEDMSDGSAMEQVYTLEEGDGVLRLGYFMPPAEEGEATFHQFDLDLTVAGEVVATRHWDQECKFIHRDAAMLSDDALPW